MNKTFTPGSLIKLNRTITVWRRRDVKENKCGIFITNVENDKIEYASDVIVKNNEVILILEINTDFINLTKALYKNDVIYIESIPNDYYTILEN